MVRAAGVMACAVPASLHVWWEAGGWWWGRGMWAGLGKHSRVSPGVSPGDLNPPVSGPHLCTRLGAQDNASQRSHGTRTVHSGDSPSALWGH